MSTSRNTCRKQAPRPSKIAPMKIYEYIKKIEIDGYPRVRAYAETIDPKIYDLAPGQITDKLDYLRDHYDGYNEIRESVLAEQQEWNLRRSGALQNKALDLLSNLIDRANEIAKDPETDAKQLNVAVTTLKSILPAFTAVGAAKESAPGANKTKRAAEYIN